MSTFLFTIGSIILFLIILSLLVIAHELGHFFVARKAGIRVDEFGLGYPPRAKKLFHRNGTDFTLNWLPLGGFVKIFGEDGSEDLSPEDQKQSFMYKPKYIQALVLVAGVTMNFLIGWILIVGLYTVGTHIIFDDTIPSTYLANTQLLIENVSPGTPAELSQLKAGDILKKLSYADHSKMLEKYAPETLTDFIRGSNGTQLEFDIVRDQQPLVILVTPQNTSGHFMVGITPELVGYVKMPFFTSIVEGFHSSIMLVKETVTGIAGLFTHKVSLDEVSGPVGMVALVGDAYKMGFEYLIFFTVIISLSLSVINLIPFPALDGGRLLFVIIEAVIRRPIPPKIANTLNTAGFVILLLLMLIVTYHDVLNLFK